MLTKKDKLFVSAMVERRGQADTDIKEFINECTEDITKMFEKTMEAKDRCDISLEEYKKMQREIESLRKKVARAEFLLEALKFPMVERVLDGVVSVDNVRCYTTDSPCDFKKKYRIEFELDMLHRW